MLEFPPMVRVAPGGDQVRVPLRVPFYGDEGDAVRCSVPELESYLKSRYRPVLGVSIVYRNPRPETTALLHDAWIVILVFNPLVRRIQERLADDVYGWMKERFKGVRKGQPRRRSSGARRVAG